MSDISKRLQREAEENYTRSLTEEGTLAAYLRGYAAGLMSAAGRMQTTAEYEGLLAAMKPKDKK